MFDRIAIIGMGLLGGSIGLAAKDKGLAGSVVGIGRNAQRLAKGVEIGAIDEYTTDFAKGLEGCDLVILCIPVERIVDFLPEVAGHVSPSAIVTDVGSTKGLIVKEAESLFTEGRGMFVGSHPLAGSDKTGVVHSMPSLFEGATCVVTITDLTPADAVRKILLFWQAIGGKPYILTPARHDALVAASSHAPHIAAASIVNALNRMGEEENLLRLVVGTGFKDTTRIASSAPNLWVEICRHNKGAIVESLARISEEIKRILDCLDKEDFDSVSRFLEEARELRRELENNK